MSSPVYGLDGKLVPQEQVLGYGRSGAVLRFEGTALKIPLRAVWGHHDDIETNTEVIQREQQVYRRLGQCEGVVECLKMSERTIQLALMENGDLRSYIATNQPSRSLQLSWFREIALALSHVHDRRVLIADIASRNFLLNADLSIRICDFSEASILPLTADLEKASDEGYTIQTDIGQVGAVMYEVITGERCEFELYEDESSSVATWPRREILPSTQDVWLGPILERCWTEGGFRNARCLYEALKSASTEEHPASTLEVWGRWLYGGYFMLFNRMLSGIMQQCVSVTRYIVRMWT